MTTGRGSTRVVGLESTKPRVFYICPWRHTNNLGQQNSCRTVPISSFELSARFSFQFALSAIGGSKILKLAQIEFRKCQIIENLRQVIGSSGGKELLQVTNNIITTTKTATNLREQNKSAACSRRLHSVKSLCDVPQAGTSRYGLTRKMPQIPPSNWKDS